jgi:cytochrome c oxidase assembly factor CtaG
MLVGIPLFATLTVVALYRLGDRPARNRRKQRLKDVSFYLGCLTVVLALESQLDIWADSLFVAHMTQHVLLLSVAPPLIVLAAPWTQIWRPLPLGFRRTVAKAIVRSRWLRPVRLLAHFVARPLPAWLLFNVNLVLWHAPGLFDATLRNQTLHDLEHATFFFTGLLFWTQVFDSPPFRARLDWLQRVAYLIAAMLVGWVVAVVLAFASAPLYAPYAAIVHRPGGLSALNDQRLAAGVMWVPGSLTFTVAILVFFYRWLDPAPQRRIAVAVARNQ